VSVTVRVLPGDPVVGLALSAALTGAGVTMRGTLFEAHVAPGHGVGFVTWTGTDLAVATSLACTLMSSCVPLTNVAGRATPPTVAVAPVANPLPVARSVKAALPAATLAGVRLVIAGVELPTAVPLTTRVIVSPSAVKFRFVVVTPGPVGLKLTTTVAVELSPTRLNGLPDTIRNGEATDAAPETVPPREFVTVND
jgi:hypothetical protein